MSNASLIYELDSKRRIPLVIGSLSLIDNITLNIDKPSDLMNQYKRLILTFLNDNKDYVLENPSNKGHFIIEYVKDSDAKEILPILYRRGKIRPILTKDLSVSIDEFKNGHVEIQKSEIEKARQLLLSSKYKRFLGSFLSNDIFYDTTDFKMKVNVEEYNKAREVGVEGFIKNDQYGLTIREALIYLYKSKRLGSMRILVEDALELWKKNLEKLSDEQLYYYARSLRSSIDEYYANINYGNKAVTNLQVNGTNLENSPSLKLICDIEYYIPLKKGQFIKTKRPA